MGKVTKEQKAAYNLKYRLKNPNKSRAYRESHAEEIKAQKAENYQNNKEKFKAKNAKYRAENPEKIKLINSNYRKNNAEKMKIYLADYRKENKETAKIYGSNYQRKRKEIDFLFKLKSNISALIRMSFKNINSKKSTKTENILGCSLSDFHFYIKSKLEPWMNNKNYGQYKPGGNRTWNIDHIIPLASAVTSDDVVRLNHYTNLRPLCSKENLDKRDKGY
jgi:hypothetical protein